MLVRSFDASSKEFIVIDITDFTGLDVEHDALTALRRISAGDRDFIFSYMDAEYPLHDTQMLMMIAAWQSPDHLTFVQIAA